MSHRAAASIALAAALALAAPPAPPSAAPPRSPAAPQSPGTEKDPSLGVVLQDPHGRAIRLSSFKGKVRVFDIWATWCGPCRMGIPHLNEIYERYRDRGVVVVGISVDDRPADVLEFQRNLPLRYPNGMINPQLEELFGATSEIPVTYVVDRAGKLRRKFIGLVDRTTLEREILGLL
jgi:thiol-disulfide isomerase/thioredoxin